MSVVPAAVARIHSAAEKDFLVAFESVKAWFQAGTVETRAAAIAQFSQIGLPHKRIEAWHYTDLRQKLQRVATLAVAPDSAALSEAEQHIATLPSVSKSSLVFVNGYFAESLSNLPSWVKKSSAPINEDKSHELYALQQAFSPQNLHFTLSGKHKKPLEIVFISTGAANLSFPKLSFTVEAGAEVSLFETQLGFDAHQRFIALNIDVKEGALCAHTRLFMDAVEAQTISNLTAQLAQTAEYNCFSLLLSGALIRNEFSVNFKGNDAKLHLSGASLLRGTQHTDTTLKVTHDALNGISRETFRHIIQDEATGVFQGKIIVKPGAQKTDGQMKSDALLLSDYASMNNKPELEIFADDVQCAHGATCGALNEDLLFYLCARGLPLDIAEALLIQAFVGEALETIEDTHMREIVLTLVTAWLDQRKSS